MCDLILFVLSFYSSSIFDLQGRTITPSFLFTFYLLLYLYWCNSIYQHQNAATVGISNIESLLWCDKIYDCFARSSTYRIVTFINGKGSSWMSKSRVCLLRQDPDVNRPWRVLILAGFTRAHICAPYKWQLLITPWLADPGRDTSHPWIGSQVTPSSQKYPQFVCLGY